MNTPKPTTDRRHNHSLRHQAQAWFDALRLHITEVEGADAIATLIQGWQKPEDVMQAYPALVPLFLDIAWRARKAPGFIELFRTDAGEVAETPSDVMALSQKSFGDIVIAHLMGTMRLVCERRKNEWLAEEPERRRGTLSKMPIVGAALRGLGLLSPVKTEVLLADYPQKGLYEALKPFLLRREQFALVEALSALPTRTVSMLGPVIGALHAPAPIRSLADLDRASVKIAIEMAETFVEARGALDAVPKDMPATPAAPVGKALAEMLCAGPAFMAVAVSHRDLAKDAITKFAPVMQGNIWTVLKDAESLRRIAECPGAVAAELQALTAEIHERVSIALAEITDARAATFAVSTLRAGVGPETFLCWIRDDAYLSGWKQLVQNINRDASVRTASDQLTPNHKAGLKAICERGVRVFAEIAEPLKKAA